MKKKTSILLKTLVPAFLAALLIIPSSRLAAEEVIPASDLSNEIIRDPIETEQDIPDTPESLIEEEELEEELPFDETNEDLYEEECDKKNIAPKRSEPHSASYLPDILRCDGDEYINQNYDAFPVLNNDNNFQGLSETKYDNINGGTVLAYSFYRVKNESANNPNVAIGILLYQTIKYRIAHPDEEMEVAFSSYRTSPTVAVCVLPESRYYGYMRALYNKDYDDYGFVRISYMLVECAKMGIKVTCVNQLASYSCYQYNAEGKLVKKAEPNYVNYFTPALAYDCYDEFAENKKVGEFMDFKKVEWTLSDKGGCDMQHVKGCVSSAYIDENGEEHHDAVYLSSSNLDTVDYRSSNAGNWSQSGVLIADHKFIFRATVNYIKLMSKYSYQEGMYELKNIVNYRNTYQARLIRAGKIDEINEDDLIVYPGTPEDPVFELYYSPLGGNAFAWDVVNNPVCKYTTELANSQGPVEFALSNPRVDNSFFLYHNIKAILTKKFVTDANVNNRLSLNGNGFDVEPFADLKAGKNIAAVNTTYAKGKTHEKDMLYSYVDKSGVKQYASVLTSCNLHSGAYFYQTNSFLVIHENENMSNRFYNHIGVKVGKAKLLYEGLKPSFDERYIMEAPLAELPKTIDVQIQLNDADLDRGDRKNGGGSIFGDNNYWSECYDYYVNAEGNPQIFYRTHDRKETTLTFDEVNVATGKPLRLTIARDAEKAYCYIDGELKQTLKNTLPATLFTPVRPHVVAANWRSGNIHHFRGFIKTLRVFSDTLTPETAKTNAASIMCNFDFTKTSNRLVDITKKTGTLRRDKMWLRDVLDPKEYDYSIALIGDTQILSEYHPDKLEEQYSWLLANKDKHKISFMVGVGDITNKAWDSEYEWDKQQIYRLNGEIPYVINRGDHDVLNKTNKEHTSVAFNDVFNDEFFLSNIDGQYQEGDLANTYKMIKLGDVDYLFLCLEVGAPDNIIEWAGKVCDEHPNHRVVVTTHVYLFRDKTTLDYDDAYCPKANKGKNSGELIWQKLVSQHDNIDYVLCGHDPCDVVTLVKSTNPNGHEVTQILSNQQDVDAIIGPTGMVTLLYFTNDGKLVAIRNYASCMNKFGSISSQMDF